MLLLWNHLDFVVSEKKAFEYFPIGSNVNLCPAVAAILDFRSAPKTKILYMTIQWTFLPSLVQICFVTAMTRLSLTLDPMGISHFHLFFWNHKTNLNQTWQKCSLDGHIQDQRRRLLNIFSIGPYVKIKSSHGGHLEFPISKRFTSLAT
jgi:hypothetical protein